MRRFWVSHLAAVGQEQRLGHQESHHLLRVTGVAPGEEVELFDGLGGRAAGVLERVEEGIAVLSVCEQLGADPTLPVWLLLAQLKRPAFDLALRMGTELGVAEILPVSARRSVVKGERRDRWERVLKAAATQCGRASLPGIQEPMSLQAALESLPGSIPRFLALPGADPVPRPKGPVAVLVGPEGGWTPEEQELALAAGARPLGLGRFTLRADTAAVAALAWATTAR